jgi:lipopolysaccharide/colanic/teichoic acid biosynthesis glycosyltransferase
MWAFFAFTFSAATAVFMAGPADVVIGTSPPLVVAIPAYIAAVCRGRRVPWIFEMRDLWPESAVTTGVLRANSLLTKALYALERWASTRATLVNVLTPAFREDLIKRGLATDSRIVFVPNGADIDLFTPGTPTREIRRELGWGDRFVVMYSGAHGLANAIGQLVEAADRLRHRKEILIACVGDGPERQRWVQEAGRRGLTNILFHGAVAKDRMPDIVRACDVGAAVLQHNPTFLTVYPNKVFDYMACAKPTLLAIDGVARELVCTQARAGLFAPPEQPDLLAAAIEKLHADPAGCGEMGRRGREWVVRNAAREGLADRYLQILERLTHPTAARKPHARTPRPFQPFLKAAIDRSAALVALLLLAPLLALLALLVRRSMGSPVFFLQPRCGRNGRPFSVVKFRTMKSGAGSDAERLTSLGRFLRSTSLDELPELWNVLRGEMSLVGPRPLLARYAERYSPEQARRHEVDPGLTGWAQVNGRNAISWEQKFALDLWYVAHWSLWLDLKILALTVVRGFRHRHAY